MKCNKIPGTCTAQIGLDDSVCSSNHKCEYQGPFNPPRPNPSPRDIFQHIKTDCERKAFDEFMLWNSNQYRVPWEDSLGESVIYALKKDKPSWYSWLQQKGLVQKEKVKKEFTAHWNTGDHRLVIGNNTIPAHTDYSETYRWEE